MKNIRRKNRYIIERSLRDIKLDRFEIEFAFILMAKSEIPI